MPDIRYYKPEANAQKFVAQEAGLLGWAFSTKEGKPALGDILYSSWGYDQTNVDFYKVLEVVGKKKIKLIKIAGSYVESGTMYGNTTSKPDIELGDAFFRLARKNSVRIYDVRTARLCDGTPKYTSFYA